ncbi:hypothetical protein FH972_010480 [Carpinus fangiana]|uniref:Uncharacterized protein n=1 Tax=Carpinus fangiana TaxID=176857 RepID=A0A660KQG3_9ROSI|nr:hypothetical protein FH972_010480 [Carpinus fangiana]
MEGVVGNPSPSLAAPPPPGSLGYDFTTFLVTKLWKCIKPKRNTSSDHAAPPSGHAEIQHSISSFPRSSTSTSPTEYSTTPPTTPSG